MRVRLSDQLGRRSRTKSHEPGYGVRRDRLHQFEAVLPVGDEGELAGVNHGDLDVIRVVQFAIRIENLVEFGMLRLLDVDDDHALRAGGNVSVGTRSVDIACIGDRHEGVLHQHRLVFVT